MLYKKRVWGDADFYKHTTTVVASVRWQGNFTRLSTQRIQFAVTRFEHPVENPATTNDLLLF